MFENLSDLDKVKILNEKFRYFFKKALECEEPLPELWEGGFDKLKKLIKENKDYENEIMFTAFYIERIEEKYYYDFWWRIQTEMNDICKNGLYTNHRNKLRKLRRKIAVLKLELDRRKRCEEQLEREMRRFGIPPEPVDPADLY